MPHTDLRLTYPSQEQPASLTGPLAAIRESAVVKGVRAVIFRTLGVGPIDQRVDSPVQSGRPFWPQAIAINSAAALVFAAFTANASRTGQDWAPVAFYLSIAWLFLPAATRLAYPEVKRSERITILLTITLSLFALRVIRAPLFFLGHDEYLHWTTAQNIVETGHLFTPNVLFPIGPFFPGLEVMVTAITTLSGASVFVSAIVCLAIVRTLFVAALFLIYERVTGSARIAALAGVFFMGCSTFAFFDTYFSYESLALPLFALAVLLDVQIGRAAGRNLIVLFGLFLLTLLALSMTHHVTAYALGAVLLGFAVLELLRGGSKALFFRLLFAAGCAILVPVLWSRAMGNPGGAYLGPVFQDALTDLAHFVQFGTPNRKLFTGDDGVVAPLWERLTTIGSVALTCIGLSLGFFRSLSWAGVPFARAGAIRGWSSIVGWSNSQLVLFTLLTLGYPISILFRLTRSGWEIGNRIGPYAFLGVGVVLAIAVVTLFQRGPARPWRAAAVGVVATILLLGGIISSEGPRILVPAKYQVSADAASIEPMGINAALWTKEWLGPGNHFAADRVNRLLLSTFGRQLVSTTLKHGYDAGEILVSEQLGPNEIETLRKLDLDYLFADLRLTTGLPVVGAYFDGGGADQKLGAPPEAFAFLKFNSINGVSRVFDNGYSIVYDVRGISGK